MRQKALVLGSDNRSFLSVVRSLGRGGIEVHVAWYQPGDPAARSRYIAKKHDLAPYQEHDDLWKSQLIDLLKNEQFDLVIPCHDSGLVPLQQHRRDLERHGRLYLLSDEAFAVFFNKFRTNELARCVGVPVPDELIVTEWQGVDAVVPKFTLPVVLKPRQSFNASTPHARHDVHKVYTLEDLDKWMRLMIEAGPVAIQENVLGTGVGIEILMKSGEPLMVFQHVRVHEPPRGGGSSYRVSAIPDPDLVDASVRLLKALDYTGVAMVEFKVDFQTGRWALIEVNGRFWGSLPLALAAKADFPLALFQMLVNGQTKFPTKHRIGLYCRNWGEDVNWLQANLEADRSDPTLTTRPLVGIITETLKNVALLRERSDTFVLDDPAPGWHELTIILSRKLSSLGEKLSRLLLQTGFSRRRLAKRFQQSLRVARRILFVCKGNICRSPYAAAVAGKQLGKQLRIDSAGYIPVPGRPSPPDAVAVSATRGYDLTGHRSQVLTETLVQNSDVIIVFDYGNYYQLLKTNPSVRNRIFLLGAIRASGQLFIEDPWNQGVKSFETCYQAIDEKLHWLMADIRRNWTDTNPARSNAPTEVEARTI